MHTQINMQVLAPGLLNIWPFCGHQSLKYEKETWHNLMYRSSHPEVFLEKVVLKICSKFTGEHPCESVVSIKLLCNFIEITLRHGCSPVNLLHIFRTPFTKNTSGRMLPFVDKGFAKAIS